MLFSGSLEIFPDKVAHLHILRIEMQVLRSAS